MQMLRSSAPTLPAGEACNARRTLIAVACLAACLLLSAPATAATGLPFQSSFETGNFSEWNGGREATMSVVSGQATDGQHSAQSVMVRGQTTDNYKDYVFGDHPWVGGQAVSAATGLWLEFDVKFDAGFQFGDCGCMHKIAILNFEDENARRRYQLIINVSMPEGTFFVEHLKWNADRSFGGVGQSFSTTVGPRIGQWDRLKLHVVPNTPGVANGTARLWVNGVQAGERTDIAVRDGTNLLPNKFIMSNYVTNTTAAGTQRWDNFYLGETDRGGSAPRVPRPPAQFQVQ